MKQLIYPVQPARTIGGSKSSKSAEMLPIVLPDLTVTAQASRSYCHSGARPLHPVVHLEIINRFGEIYLQKRSASKDLLPNRWDTAVGGHISYGEYIEEALFREAAEELGLTSFNPIFVDAYIFEADAEKELVNLFAIVGAFKPHPDGEEVSDGRWWSRDEIEKNLGKDVFTPMFEREYALYRDKLIALL